MSLQVHPLQVLAKREVIMKRMDYSTYLTSITKEELHRLDELEGKYRIKSSKVTIEERYNAMAKDCQQMIGSISRSALKRNCIQVWLNS